MASPNRDADHPHSDSDGYSRSLLDRGMKIKSVCLACGYTIVSSVDEGLPDQEREHREACDAKAVSSPA
jgi:hypothetical protein